MARTRSPGVACATSPREPNQTNGSMHLLPGDIPGAAHGMNGGGTVVGLSDDQGRHAVLWENPVQPGGPADHVARR
jgi:hypothetical protein